jgi:hypothetical protein
MLIYESWLEQAGFRWHQAERQPCRHWLLWLGGAINGGAFSSVEDLGVEVSRTLPAELAWHCWLRADTAHRYSRFIHIRCLLEVEELVALIEGITGHPFNPGNALYGALHTAEQAGRIRKSENRLDRVLMHAVPWSSIERDRSRGGALPEHLEYFEKENPGKRNS